MAKKKKNSDGYDDDGQLNLDDMLFSADQRHYRDTEQYVARADRLYGQAIKRLSELATQVGNIPQSQSFSFQHNKAVAQKVQQTILDLASSIEAVVDAGCRHEWDAACIKGDKYIEQIRKTADLAEEKIKTYQDRNLEALAAFQERKVEGLNLSERVWKMVSPLKEEVELVVDTTAKYYDHGTGINTKQAITKIQEAIGSGTSAAELSRQVRECLREPNKLFRRVKDKYGNLTLSKAAQIYHPGQGVYRSSYKNAMRMCRTEINMAYRQSDTMRWQQLDFVVGMEVNLSNNHTTKDPKSKGVIKLIDICDELKGKYPKDFKFVGWHPQCRCFVTPILKTLDEIDAERQQHDQDGNIIPQPSQNAVTDVPDNFKQYVQTNAERISGWSSTPYYIKDNPQYFDKALHPEKYKGTALVLTADQTKLMSELQAYGNNHQGSKKFAAALEQAQKAQLAGDLDAFEKAVKEMEKVRKTNEGTREYLKDKRSKKQNVAKDDRHQYDARIEAIKSKAKLYGLDYDKVMQAYTSLDINQLETIIREQETLLSKAEMRRKLTLERAKARQESRTESEKDNILARWMQREDNNRVSLTRMSEDELKEYVKKILGDNYSYTSRIKAIGDVNDKLNDDDNAMKRYLFKLSAEKGYEGIKDIAIVYSNSEDPLVKHRLIERIRERALAKTKKDLEDWGTMDGLTYVGITPSFKVGHNSKLYAKGKTIDIKQKVYDLITYKDADGHTYSYPLCVSKENIKNTVEAGKGAKAFMQKPKYIRENTKGFVFLDDDHPMDPYYRVKYPDFTRGAMYSSDPITVHTRYNPERFADDACHETGHHIYYKHGLEKEYEEAVKKDKAGQYPTTYSKSATTEDFAETIELLNKGGADRDNIIMLFPNRYQFIKDHVPNYEDYYNPREIAAKQAAKSVTSSPVKVSTTTPSYMETWSKQIESTRVEARLESSKVLAEFEDNLSKVTTTKELLTVLRDTLDKTSGNHRKLRNLIVRGLKRVEGYEPVVASPIRRAEKIETLIKKADLIEDFVGVEILSEDDAIKIAKELLVGRKGIKDVIIQETDRGFGAFDPKTKQIILSSKTFLLQDGAFNMAISYQRALAKIKKGEILSMDEEYAIESIHHEFLHASARGWLEGKINEKNAAMETINQFIARHSYTDTLSMFHVSQKHRDEIIDHGFGYILSIKNLRLLLARAGVKEQEFVAEFRTKLLQTPYDNIKDELINYFKDRGIKKAKELIDSIDKGTETFIKIMDV